MRFAIYNAVLFAALAFSGRLRSDRASVAGVVGGLAIMNLVAWISSRHYNEWK